MSNVFDTSRVPGGSCRSAGRSFRFSDGSRNIVITVACERSLSKMSPLTNEARDATPAASAAALETSTRPGSNSMPSARAPLPAAAMTVRPSPDPRSMTKSLAVTWARSSMASTTASADGIQTTSLPGWP